MPITEETVYDLFEKALKPGESIVWRSKPNEDCYFENVKQDFNRIFITINGGLSLMIAFQIFTHDKALIPTVMALLFGVVLLPFFQLAFHHKIVWTYYALSNRRIFYTYNNEGDLKLGTKLFLGITKITLKSSSSTIGSIVFSSWYKFTSFDCIEDAADVYNLITTLKAEEDRKYNL